MKYRRLSSKELQELEKEFTLFLASQGIDAPEWSQIKKTNPSKAEELIESFSDFVLCSSMEQIDCLVHRTPSKLKIFYFAEDAAELIGLDGDDTIDFTAKECVDAFGTYLTKQASGSIQVYHARKKYKCSKTEEIFQLTEMGCLVSDASLFFQVKKLI